MCAFEVAICDMFCCLQSQTVVAACFQETKSTFTTEPAGLADTAMSMSSGVGMHVSLVEHLCDSVVSGTLSSGCHTHMMKPEQGCTKCPDIQERPAPRIQDVRNLVGLLVGYMLMKDQPARCPERRMSSLSVSEVQCIVQETLATQEEADFAPATAQLCKWATGIDQC